MLVARRRRRPPRGRAGEQRRRRRRRPFERAKCCDLWQLQYPCLHRKPIQSHTPRRSYHILNSLFEDEDDFAATLEDVVEADDLVALGAGGQHGDLVEDLGRAVLPGAVAAAAWARARAVLGRVLHAGLAMSALAHGGEETAGKRRKTSIWCAVQ